MVTNGAGVVSTNQAKPSGGASAEGARRKLSALALNSLSCLSCSLPLLNLFSSRLLMKAFHVLLMICEATERSEARREVAAKLSLRSRLSRLSSAANCSTGLNNTKEAKKQKASSRNFARSRRAENFLAQL
jgi:hypothetical protein